MFWRRRTKKEAAQPARPLMAQPIAAAQPAPMRFVDLRSAEEQDIEAAAQSQLAGEDETIARRLAELSQLSDRQYQSDRAAYDETVEEFKRLGEQLCANGGDERMKRVAYRVQALGGRSRDCEMYWNGICGWMA